MTATLLLAMTSYQAASALREGQLVEILKPFVGDPIPVQTPAP
jgi:hypothetical protein